MRHIDLEGKKFHELLVLKRTEDRYYKCGQKHVTWECLCSCGNIVKITSHSLRRGLTKSCGCLGNYCNKPDQYTPFRRLLVTAKRDRGRQSRKSLAARSPVTITLEDMKKQWEKQKGICPYTGWKLILKENSKRGRTTPTQASLDRVDSSRGYVKGNIQFVSLMANYAKNCFDDDFLIYFCKCVSRKHPDYDSHTCTEEEMKEIKEKVENLERFCPL